MTTRMPVSDSGPWRSIFRVISFLAVLYLFFISIDLMSSAFKMFGKDFTDRLIGTASDPLAGLIIGFLTTSLIQSSSTTTSIIVGLVAAGTLPLGLATPMIMEANIGTTITAILSSFSTGSPAAVTVAFAHLSFNILGIVLLYPFKFIPIRLAEFCGKLAARTKGHAARLIAIYIALHIIPIL